MAVCKNKQLTSKGWIERFTSDRTEKKIKMIHPNYKNVIHLYLCNNIQLFFPHREDLINNEKSSSQNY